MAPETRSRGVPAPSRVYHSEPSLQQLQFPSRRKAVRTYGKQAQKKDTPSSLRQQTLTQIEFVSSFDDEEDPIVLSDSEADEFEQDDGDDKENQRPSATVGVQNQLELYEADEEPVPSGRKRIKRPRVQDQKSEGQGKRDSKRRRTLGDRSDEDNAEESRKSRRKTLGDVPSSTYHTQTLTQFMGRNPFIKDSDDENDGDDDKGFHNWLGDASQATREESVVPQTPVKRIRFEIPSSSQQSTPLSSMMDRYGPLGEQVSPLKGHSPSIMTSPPSVLPGKARNTPGRRDTPGERGRLVIQDSFATASWPSGDATPTKSSPLKSQLETMSGTATSPVLMANESSCLDAMSTPTKPPANRRESAELGEGIPTSAGKKPNMALPTKRLSPKAFSRNGIYEIPDSDEEEEDEDENDENNENNDDNEDHNDDESNTETESNDHRADHESFIAGPETQFAMAEIASSEEFPVLGTNPTPSITHPRPLPAQKSSSPELPQARPLRRPLHHPAPQHTNTQPLESQRVPLAILQCLPPASVRTDILLPVNPSTLAAVLAGTKVHVPLPFRIPAQVVRFWLLDGGMLRYMASTEAAVPNTGGWRYRIPQVYELNNPVAEEDMRDEGWVEGDIGRYQYVPPAVVSQMLWNLRHAVFGDEEDEDGDAPEEMVLPGPRVPAKNKTPSPSVSESQQLEAQIQSDIAQSTQFPQSDDVVPSTPDEEALVNLPCAAAMEPPTRPSRPNLPSSASRNPSIHPSQTTTVSQASTPEKSHPPASMYTSARPQHHHQQHPSSSLVFQDYGSASSIPGVASDLPLSPSQLLTESQMLSDSLIRDDAVGPPEIWDSEDDADERL